jgi:TorA maturation chaperone TorD
MAPEDQARADFYALLARLFREAPDASLLVALAGAPSLAADAGNARLAVDSGAAPMDPDGAVDRGTPGDLAGAWDALRAASAGVEPAAAGDEHQALFVGIGRSAVSPYASHYLAPQSGRLLAELRSTLARLGLARKPTASEYEDHIALVLETMRVLVAGEGQMPPACIAEQRAFFDRYVASWAFECCDAIQETPLANFYRQVAQFARCFLAIERDSFAME